MIEFKDVEISYGSFTAVKNLNLVINEGEFFTFLGPSGCGKTTTLRALAGFLSPSKGSIFINDNDVTSMPVEKRGIGMVFQSYALFPTMTVYENLAFGLKIKKKSKEEINKKIAGIAEKIKISGDQLKRNVSELSGGQQQRIALARALILEPDILCLDEPLSNLDAKLRVNLRGELKRLQKDLGITTLYVTHDQEEALTLSDRIAVFNEGCIEQVGTPVEIYNNSASAFVCEFIGDINSIGDRILGEINKKSVSTKFAPDKKAFIRLERVLTEEKDGFLSLPATVTDIEYNGVFTKYSLAVCGEEIKCLEKNDGRNIRAHDSKLTIYVNPSDIMQF